MWLLHCGDQAGPHSSIAGGGAYAELLLVDGYWERGNGLFLKDVATGKLPMVPLISGPTLMLMWGSTDWTQRII